MEEVEIGETPNDNIKEIELIEGNIKYKCEIKKEKDVHGDYLDISVYNNKIKYKGIIRLYNIQYQLGALNCSIGDIFLFFSLFKNPNFIKYIIKYIYYVLINQLLIIFKKLIIKRK